MPKTNGHVYLPTRRVLDQRQRTAPEYVRELRDDCARVLKNLDEIIAEHCPAEESEAPVG